MSVPELLSPAGCMDSLKAAVANGASAVYLGGKRFSARAGADNFSEEELPAAICYAHLHGVKVYITINTLVRYDEFEDVLDYIYRLCEWNADGIIVQDLGLIYASREIFPSLPLIASTQMSAHNSCGVSFLVRTGVRRVILARELSLKDLSQIRSQSQAELEVFIHGALCVCYSGQCLMSSMIGGRSGNRGRCAQPCRMPYSFLTDREDRVETEGAYLLSPKDLHGYSRLPSLIETGIDSLKIEGRMKRPEYVATVVRHYQELLASLNDENIKVDSDNAKRELLQVFNRDETSGYWLGSPGRDLIGSKRPNNRGVYAGRVISAGRNTISIRLEQPLAQGDGLEIWVSKGGRNAFTADRIMSQGISVISAEPGETVVLYAAGRVGDRVFKTYDKRLMQAAADSYKKILQIPVRIALFAKAGDVLRGDICDDAGNRAEVVLDYCVQLSRNSPSDESFIKKQLSRMGGSGFILSEALINADDNIMIPASVLNRLRRKLLQSLTNRRLDCFRRSPIPQSGYGARKRQIYQDNLLTGVSTQKKPPVSLSVMCDIPSAEAAAEAGADIIYISYDDCKEGFRPDKSEKLRKIRQYLTGRGIELVMGVPQIFHDDEEAELIKSMSLWQKLGINSLLSGNMGILKLCEKANWQGEIYADLGFNVFNPFTLRFLQEMGFIGATMSLELTLAQIRLLLSKKALFSKINIEAVVHSPLQLMVSEYCMLGGVLGGRTLNNPCSMPCKKSNRYYIKDEKGYVFPCRSDSACRMHVYNSRELCLLEDINHVAALDLDRLRLDLRLHDTDHVSLITECYRRALNGENTKKLIKKAEDLCMRGMTKGHYYRGVE